MIAANSPETLLSRSSTGLVAISRDDKTFFKNKDNGCTMQLYVNTSELTKKYSLAQCSIRNKNRSKISLPTHRTSSTIPTRKKQGTKQKAEQTSLQNTVILSSTLQKRKHLLIVLINYTYLLQHFNIVYPCMGQHLTHRLTVS